MKKINPVGNHGRELNSTGIILESNSDAERRGIISNGVKALVLLSGGLDSMLAAKVLMEQGIKVTGLSFISCFFGADKAEKAAFRLGIELKKVDFKEEHLEMVKNPASGYGKCLNPCLDCHALMIKWAEKYLTSPQPSPLKGERVNGISRRNYDFIATGEVLGQRPMSQNRNSLRKVEKLAGIEVLRPLSAWLLSETEIEKRGMADRKKLLDINGRGRKRQMELAKKYGFTDYPAPAGGCLLTDPTFSKQIREMIKRWPECGPNDVELLKYGRIFWAKKILIVIGRNESDNRALEKLAKGGDVIIELEKVKGPFTVVRFKNYDLRFKNKVVLLSVPRELDANELKLDEIKDEEKILKVAGLLTGWYVTKARGKEARVKIREVSG